MKKHRITVETRPDGWQQFYVEYAVEGLIPRWKPFTFENPKSPYEQTEYFGSLDAAMTRINESLGKVKRRPPNEQYEIMNRKYRIIQDTMADKSLQFYVQFTDMPGSEAIWAYATTMGPPIAASFTESLTSEPHRFADLDAAKTAIDKDIADRKANTRLISTLIDYP